MCVCVGGLRVCLFAVCEDCGCEACGVCLLQVYTHTHSLCSNSLPVVSRTFLLVLARVHSSRARFGCSTCSSTSGLLQAKCTTPTRTKSKWRRLSEEFPLATLSRHTRNQFISLGRCSRHPRIFLLGLASFWPLPALFCSSISRRRDPCLRYSRLRLSLVLFLLQSHIRMPPLAFPFCFHP